MQSYTITRDNERDLQFSGETISSVDGSDRENNKCTRYWNYTLYRTEGETLIAHKVNISRWVDEKQESLAKVCSNESDVIEFFGYSDLAKRLYSEARITCTQRIE